MNPFSSEFKKKVATIVNGKQPLLVTGVAGSGKLYGTKLALQDAHLDFELIQGIDSLQKLPLVFKTIGRAPDKNYLIDIDNGSLTIGINSLLDSMMNGSDVQYKSKSVNLKFVVTGKIVIVAPKDACETTVKRCYHIEC